MLQKIDLLNFELENQVRCAHLALYYQVFGQPLGTAKVVVVNHALTGNSQVAGPQGWWNSLVGTNKTIDTNEFTIIAFNIPGNGFDGVEQNLISNYKDFTIRDIAKIFWRGLNVLDVDHVFAIIGGSLGGATAWEMTLLAPAKVEHLIPIASDWKATDWVVANVLIQDQILNNSTNPIVDARLHAMLLYRTPQSINQRFVGKKVNETGQYEVEKWLSNHGVKLKNRFELQAYKLMNHLLRTNDITRGRTDFVTLTKNLETKIHIVAVDSDLFFTADENLQTYQDLKSSKNTVFYNEIKSIHGHDAFLIEFEQLNEILFPIFSQLSQKLEKKDRKSVV